MYNGVNQTNTGTFVATFHLGGEVIRIGEFANEIDAAIAHDVAVVATLGEEFATDLNFPELTESDLDFIAVTC